MTERAIFLLAGADAGALGVQVSDLRDIAGRSPVRAELAARNEAAAAGGPRRAAIVAAGPEELAERIDRLRGWLDESEAADEGLRVGRGVVLGTAVESPRVGFLFPGQGAPVLADPGVLADWFPRVARVYEEAGELASSGEVPAELVQLSTVAASVAGLRALEALGIGAGFAVGHSVGELTALHWAGALGEEAVLRIAQARGAAMTEHALAEGAMASIEADEDTFARLVGDSELSVACFNSPRHRVVSGTSSEVDALLARAREQGEATAVRLRVVGAFHSPLMRDAAPVFERYLADQELGRPGRPVFSTVSGAELASDADLGELLVRQISEPVRFVEALEAAGPAQLLLEVGPGRMLSGLASEFAQAPVLPLRVGHASSQAFLTAVGAAFVVGAPLRAEGLPPSGD